MAVTPSTIAGTIINTGTGTTTVSVSGGLVIQNGGTWIHNSTGGAISTPIANTIFNSGTPGATFIFKR